MRTLIALLLLAPLVAGCGDNDEPTSQPEAEPVEVTLVVELIDALPLSALYNADDVRCSVGSILGGSDVEITVRDGSGEIVATEELETGDTGGEFTDGEGCTWTVEIVELEASNFYEVSVQSGSVLDESETVELDGDEAEAQFAF